MPFITEEIYHQLKERKPDDDLTIKQSEGRLYGDGLILLHGSLLKDFITSIRDTRNKNQLKPKDPITIHVKPYKDLFSTTELILKKQVNAEEIIYTDKSVADSIVVVVKNFKFYLKTKLTIDTSIQKDQLLKDLEYQKGFLLSVEKKLSNERFVQNAKPEVVEVEKKKKADAEAKIKAIEESLASL
jgi:valyl-tRNA synthetase